MRTLLVPAALLALSCAGASKPLQTALQAGPAIPTAAVPPGMERQPDESVAEYDLNRDGKPDLWKYTRKDATGKEILVRKEKDLNGDGRVDTWELYAPDGSLVRVVYDLDFDGKPDVTLFFEKDQLVKKEYALGFEGKGRSWSYYEKGKLVRKERDTVGDGKVHYWEYWENGEIDRIGIDLDGDGQVDKWESRHPAEGEAAPAAAAPAAAAQK